MNYKNGPNSYNFTGQAFFPYREYSVANIDISQKLSFAKSNVSITWS